MPRFQPLFDATLRWLAWGLLGSLFLAALHDVSQAWDVWSYHLPFAARLWGIVEPPQFVFSAGNEGRYAGFPLLTEWLQGLLWRVARAPTAANLVAFASVPVLAALLRRYFSVPFHLTVLGLLAIPLVQIHSTSCYIDLPANCALAALVLLTFEAYVNQAPLPRRAWLLALGCAAVAANMKSLSHPLVLAAVTMLGLRGVVIERSAQRRKRLLLLLVWLAVVFAIPLRNLVVYRNPYFPVRLTVLGHHFPGTEDPYSSSPVWLKYAARQLRFAASALEIHSSPVVGHGRWTIDQWTPSGAPGYRMGGFFGAYVFVQLAWLVWTALRQRSRPTRVTAIGFAALTGLVSCLPQSHELRYYMVWMIVLVAINLWHASNQRSTRAALGGVSVAALAVVLFVTRARYVYPSGLTFAQLVQHETDPRRLSGVPENARVCVVREPYNLLWAAVFHPPRHYRVTEAERAQDCTGDITIR